MSDATEKTKGAVSGLQTAGIAAMAAVIGALVSAWFPYLSRDRELDIRLVEIGVGILRADPEKSGVSAARQWAIVAIEENSGIEFTPKDRAELLENPLGWGGITWGSDPWGETTWSSDAPRSAPLSSPGSPKAGK